MLFYNRININWFQVKVETIKGKKSISFIQVIVSFPLTRTIKIRSIDIEYQKIARDKNLIIKNAIYTDKIIYNIQPLGFSLLSYLLYESRNQGDTFSTISIAMKSLNIKVKKTVIKYFEILKENKLISYKENLDNLDINSKFDIDLRPYYLLEGGFEKIPAYIFIDYYSDESEWTIFCLLCMYINNKYGNAIISYGNITDYTGIKHNTTIKQKLMSLIDLGLLEVISIKTNDNEDMSFENFESASIFSQSHKYKINFIKKDTL